MTRLATCFRGFRRDATGISAVEFAVLLPMLIILMFGGFAVTKTVAISRKLTITTRALADLTSQYNTMAQTDLTTVFNASTQIIAPFDASPLTMRITSVQLDATGLIATVAWSQPTNTTYVAGAVFPLPVTMPRSPNSSFIYAETFYTYKPALGSNIIQPIQLGDRIYMLPRVSSSVAYTGP